MKIQIDDLIRDATAEEIAAIEFQNQEYQKRLQEQAAKEAKRQEVLAKLGLTPEEAQALLG